MAQIQLSDVTFQYPESAQPALHTLNLQIEKGEFIVLCGPSGSGKSTLMRLLMPELHPAGRLQGAIRYEGHPLSAYGKGKLCAEIGMVGQNPESQIVMERVWSELYFGMENAGIEPGVMKARLSELAQYFDLEPLLEKLTSELSGGQQQLLNLASVLLLHPKVLVLDEPTAQLNPIAVRELLHFLKLLNEEHGVTVVMSEHRLDEVWPLADRVLFLQEGRLVWDGPPSRVTRSLLEKPELELFVPPLTRFFRDFDDAEPLPLTQKEGKRRLSLHEETARKAAAGIGDLRALPRSNPSCSGTLIEVKQLAYRYPNQSHYVLQQCSLAVQRGEHLMLFGANGSGKSTLLQLLAGLLKPQLGKLTWEGKPAYKALTAGGPRLAGYLPQRLSSFFVSMSVKEELETSARLAQSYGVQAEGPEAAAARYGLQYVWERHPHDLSGGEQQQLALACILMFQPQALLLDEPTKGLDPIRKKALADLLRQEQSGGTAIVTVTHDVEFAAEHADRCMLLFHGEIMADEAPRTFFSGNYMLTTSLNKLLRDWNPYVLGLGDIGLNEA